MSRIPPFIEQFGGRGLIFTVPREGCGERVMTKDWKTGEVRDLTEEEMKRYREMRFRSSTAPRPG